MNNGKDYNGISKQIRDAAKPTGKENVGIEEILRKLLDEIKEVDFVKKVHGVDKSDKDKFDPKIHAVNQKHYRVLAAEEILRAAKRLKFPIVRENGKYYLFDTTHWVGIDTQKLKDFLGECAIKTGVPSYTARPYEFREHLFKQFEADAQLEKVAPPEDSVLLNMRNGTLVVTRTDHYLKAHEPSDFITYCLPFCYDENATSPKFDKFLAEMLPDIPSQHVLSEFLAYVFVKTSYLKLEKALFMYGTGGNGKSVVLDIIESLFGKDNLANYSLSSLTHKTHMQYRAAIADKLLNVSSEIDGSMNIPMFKQLVSGESTEARFLYGQPFNMTNYAKLAFSMNTMPASVEHTHAFFRRFIIIHFENTVTDEKKDPELAKKIIADEMPGILNWVLKGLGRIMKQRDFSKCEASKASVERFKRESDSVAMFIDEFDYEPSKNEQVLQKAIFGEYKSFCEDDNYRPVSTRKFSERLRALGFEDEKKEHGKIIYAQRKQ